MVVLSKVKVFDCDAKRERPIYACTNHFTYFANVAKWLKVEMLKWSYNVYCIGLGTGGHTRKKSSVKYCLIKLYLRT